MLTKRLKKKDDNGDMPGGQLAEALKALTAMQQDVRDRLDELESKKDLGGEARLLIATRVFDTDREHLPEMTNIPLRAVKPYSLADMSARILDPDVQCGKVTLGQIRRESVYRHLRSVRGNLLDKGTQLAMEQTKQAELEDIEGTALGRGM